MAFKSKTFMNKKHWGDLNFVGRKALKSWSGNTDLGDATYILLLQTSGDGGKKKKKTLEKNTPTICTNDAM